MEERLNSSPQIPHDAEFGSECDPLVAEINDDYTRLAGKTTKGMRDIGIKLVRWKVQVGRGNWMKAYAEWKFLMSIDTAERWMATADLTDEQLEGLTLTQALKILPGRYDKSPAKQKAIADKLAKKNAEHSASTKEPPFGDDREFIAEIREYLDDWSEEPRGGYPELLQGLGELIEDFKAEIEEEE